MVVEKPFGNDLASAQKLNADLTRFAHEKQILRIDRDKVFFDSIKDVGHIISSDNIVNLCELQKTEKIKSGDKLLLLMAGFGLNWQAVLLESV